MTEIPQTSKKNDSELPSISNKQDEEDNKNSHLDKSQDDNNVLPLTHAQKRKKHRKKFRKHSPQYYEQKRLEKFNKKLEQKWDSHFINDQIPDLYPKKKKTRPQGKTLSKLTSEKRSITPLNYKIPGNTVGSIASKKQSLPLPKIEKTSSKRSNSFNVHVIHHKPTQKSQKVEYKKEQSKTQEKPTPDIVDKRKRTSQLSKRPVEQQKQKDHLQEYRKRLNELFEEKKFLNCHKQVLESFFEGLEKKNVRDLLDKEFELLKKKQSLIFKVMNAITNRQSFLEKVKTQSSKLTSGDKQTLQLIDHYRTSTLAVVQEILKWKESWHASYYEKFKKSKNFDLIYKTQNYLLTLISSTDSLLSKIQRNAGKLQQQKVTQSPNLEKSSLPKQFKTSDKANIEFINQQKLPTETNQKQQLQKDIKTEDKPALPETLNIKDKAQSSKKIEPSSVKQTYQTKNTGQKFQPIHNTSKKDPFLISLHSIAKQDKNIILKIRACELLLIEQSFNSIKK